MLPGDFALVHADGPLGYAVGAFTASRYSHVRLIVSEDGETVEANFDGADRGFVEPGDLVVRAPLTNSQRLLVPDLAGGLLGIPYGFRDVAALGLAQLGIHTPSLDKQIERPDRLFCSQLVDFVWRLAGFHAFRDGRLPQNVSPGDLADLAFRSGWDVYTI